MLFCSFFLGVFMSVSIRARHCWRAMQSEYAQSMADDLVSIRARHCWRAMHAIRGVRVYPFMFQSAPAIAGGRCTPAQAASHAVPVSIRARHCWRAMRLVGHTLMLVQ